jgi:Kef-type K+ transport system membrane component KefB
MENGHAVLITFGVILLLGLASDYLGRRTALPRVTTILIFGAIIGPEALNLIPRLILDNFNIIAQITLVMVGFLLGERLAWAELKKTGRGALVISISAAIFTCLIVCLGLVVLGVPVEIALLLGCIAAATAPEAVVDIAVESGVDSRFTRRLLAIVALDDAWALLLFSVGIAMVMALNGTESGESPILFSLREIFGAVMLGVAIGLPASYLTGRIKPGQPMLTEALGIDFLGGGLAIWLEVSFLITAMTMGVVIANLARHHEQPFRAIEGVEWPLLAIFFVLAGASLDVEALIDIGWIGFAYVIFRSVGKIAGAWIGGELSRIESMERLWTGAALLPQAGAAMGMALVASSQFPEYRQFLLPIVIGSTVVFEIVGPVVTRRAMNVMDG